MKSRIRILMCIKMVRAGRAGEDDDGGAAGGG